MTDKILVSRSEIEKLLTQLNITHQDIRALLDKAEVSEQENKGYPLIRLGYGLVEVGTGHIDGEPVIFFTNHGNGIIGDNTINDIPRVNNKEDIYAAISITKIDSLNVVREQLDIFASTYLNETKQTNRVAELEAENTRLRDILDKAAISQAEPVAEVILDKMFLPALKVPLVDFKIDLKELQVGTKLYTLPPPADKQDAEIGRLVRSKLISGNDVPVSRCYITSSEVEAIDAAMQKGE